MYNQNSFHKTPGPDDFPGEFYLIFKKNKYTLLHEVFPKTGKVEFLSKSFLPGHFTMSISTSVKWGQVAPISDIGSRIRIKGLTHIALGTITGT